MHIYIFGSLCRGEVDLGSDVDLLAVTEGPDPRFDSDLYSIYSYKRIRKLWNEGNPFAWHLATEAKLVFAGDGGDFLRQLGHPAAYNKCAEDCKKFIDLFEATVQALKSNEYNRVFELSSIFLAIRNFATCFSLGTTGQPNFSRHSPKMMGQRSLNISDEAYQLLERARILSTRATGLMIQAPELNACVQELDEIGHWMYKLYEEIPANG